MLSISSRIWTRLAVSISYDDNHYTTDSSMFNGISTHYGLFDSEIWFICLVSSALFLVIYITTKRLTTQ